MEYNHLFTPLTEILSTEEASATAAGRGNRRRETGTEHGRGVPEGATTGPQTRPAPGC